MTMDGEEVYTGQFVNLMRYGQGECTYPAKQVKFQGNWENGQVVGSGTIVNLKDGTKTIGNAAEIQSAA